jgi:hypothetical protein
MSSPLPPHPLCVLRDGVHVPCRPVVATQYVCLERIPSLGSCTGSRLARLQCRTAASLISHCAAQPLSPQVTLNGSSFDTLLAAYTGAAVNATSLVASNDNCTMGGSPGASCITFTISQNTVYSLQVDGANGARGAVSIEVSFVWAAPSNDDFLTAVSTFPATGTTLAATLEAGEPRTVGGKAASGSVWYRFTASVNATAQVE